MVVISLTEHHRAPKDLLSCTYVLYYVSVIINPVTYVFTSKPFQIRIKQFLDTRKAGRAGEGIEPVHVNDQASFEVGRGRGSLVETSDGLEGVVTMDYDDSDAELIDAYSYY